MEKIIVKLPAQIKSNKTERGELMRFFIESTNPYRGNLPRLTFPRMGKLIQGLDMHTLHYMKSAMYDLRGEKAAKWFWWSLKEEDKGI